MIRIIASKGRWTTFCDSQGLHIYLLASPWVVWLIYIVSALSIGLKDRRKVFRAVLYCVSSTSHSLPVSSLTVSTLFRLELTGYRRLFFGRWYDNLHW